MKRIFIIIGLLIVLLLPAVSLSCVVRAAISKRHLGQEFTLPVGKTADIDGEGLSIKFEEVIGDSRCAKGVECVWAGEAKCRLLINILGSPAEMILTQPGGDIAATDYFLQYKVSFKLEPYPEAGKQIAASDYKLVMTVTE